MDLMCLHVKYFKQNILLAVANIAESEKSLLIFAHFTFFFGAGQNLRCNFLF